ncbi:MAG: hypothetical protein QOF35_227, partial [Actinomycetota bacterium]|nr:hypothetical protein [Actinomycetota bacterium]
PSFHRAPAARGVRLRGHPDRGLGSGSRETTQEVAHLLAKVHSSTGPNTAAGMAILRRGCSCAKVSFASPEHCLAALPSERSGMWRSLVAHLTGGQGVAGSNPVIPTGTSRSRAVSEKSGAALISVAVPRRSCPKVIAVAHEGSRAGAHAEHRSGSAPPQGFHHLGCQT